MSIFAPFLWCYEPEFSRSRPGQAHVHVHGTGYCYHVYVLVCVSKVEFFFQCMVGTFKLQPAVIPILVAEPFQSLLCYGLQKLPPPPQLTTQNG